MSLPCNQQNKDTYFQCQYNANSNIPMTRQLSVSELTSTTTGVPISLHLQMHNTGRFHRGHLQQVGAPSDNYAVTTNLDYLNVAPSVESSSYYRW